MSPIFWCRNAWNRIRFRVRGGAPVTASAPTTQSISGAEACPQSELFWEIYAPLDASFWSSAGCGWNAPPAFCAASAVQSAAIQPTAVNSAATRPTKSGQSGNPQARTGWNGGERGCQQDSHSPGKARYFCRRADRAPESRCHAGGTRSHDYSAATTTGAGRTPACSTSAASRAATSTAQETRTCQAVWRFFLRRQRSAGAPSAVCSTSAKRFGTAGTGRTTGTRRASPVGASTFRTGACSTSAIGTGSCRASPFSAGTIDTGPFRTSAVCAGAFASSTCDTCAVCESTVNRFPSTVFFPGTRTSCLPLHNDNSPGHCPRCAILHSPGSNRSRASSHYYRIRSQ
jgi:hypothetical protein